ncbi:hypothetical protein M885DRAFT_551179 [Pelagophyceae sp. CCMP2097]|nr:hypothetical protein M885DRAFT_551179 [Pelagophyceae sp. CCMP2097]
MVLLAQDQFLAALTKLFVATRDHDSLSITFKRMTETYKVDGAADVVRQRCLVRARTQNKKLSTLVDVSQLLKFSSGLGLCYKGNMDKLKRKERSKKPKADAPASPTRAASATKL